VIRGPQKKNEITAGGTQSGKGEERKEGGTLGEKDKGL